MPMNVISPIDRPVPIAPPVPDRHGRLPAAAARDAARAQSDEATISRFAHLLDRLRALPEVRQERIERVQREVAAGSYETPEKLDAAVTALLDELE
jgi:hypothetical protein